MEPEMYDLVEMLDDIIVLSEEPWMFEVRPGVRDIGVAERGIQLVQQADTFDVDQIRGITNSQWVRVVKAELDSYSMEVMDAFMNDQHLGTIPKVLIFMVKKAPSELIRAFIFEEARLIPVEPVLHLERGGSPLTKFEWTYQDAFIWDQMEPDGNEMMEVDR